MDEVVDEAAALQAVSTGSLPDERIVSDLLRRAHSLYRDEDEGTVSSYIPALASADPSLFGIALASVDGTVHSTGDAEHPFTVQSLSKPFIFALACEAVGVAEVRSRVGGNNTGLGFNSVIAIELNDGHPRNPMVNAGAITTTSLLTAETPEARWARIQEGLSRFAGRPLEVNTQVYESESATNHRNRALANLLKSYGRLDEDPLVVTDLYTRQCALEVTVRDIAVMGATLANGGVNPVTHETVISPAVCSGTLATLASSGLYEGSGDWLIDVGVPGKSGVSGGIITVAPGKGSLATFSPPLDKAGNSIRGQWATTYLTMMLGLNLFASRPPR